MTFSCAGAARRAGCACVFALVSSCETGLRQPDPDFNRMLEVPRYDAYEEGAFFEDRMVMRAPPSGTLAYDGQPVDSVFELGLREGAFVSTFPVEITRRLLERGRASYEVVCAACHGIDGHGNEMVVRHMGRRPPSLHEARVRRLSPGEIYFVIRNGYGFMPAFSTHLDIRERWAVAAYVKALELSRHAPLAELSPALRSELQGRLP